MTGAAADAPGLAGTPHQEDTWSPAALATGPLLGQAVGRLPGLSAPSVRENTFAFSGVNAGAFPEVLSSFFCHVGWQEGAGAHVGCGSPGEEQTQDAESV